MILSYKRWATEPTEQDSHCTSCSVTDLMSPQKAWGNSSKDFEDFGCFFSLSSSSLGLVTPNPCTSVWICLALCRFGGGCAKTYWWFWHCLVLEDLVCRFWTPVWSVYWFWWKQMVPSWTLFLLDYFFKLTLWSAEMIEYLFWNLFQWMLVEDASRKNVLSNTLLRKVKVVKNSENIPNLYLLWL